MRPSVAVQVWSGEASTPAGSSADEYRGRIVNKTFGPLDQQLRERHDASDFDRRTQDKIEVAE